MTSWSLRLGLFVSEKSQNRAKSCYSFHWELKEDRTLILTYFNGYFWFWSSSGDILGSKLDQKLKFRALWKFFIRIWDFRNPLNGTCKTMKTSYGQSFSSMWHCLLELLPPNLLKLVQVGPEPKKALLFLLGKVENNKFPEDETWHSDRRWMTLMGDKSPGGNLDPICVQKMFVCLILQEFCDFFGTWDFHCLIFLRMQFLQKFWF